MGVEEDARRLRRHAERMGGPAEALALIDELDKATKEMRRDSTESSQRLFRVYRMVAGDGGVMARGLGRRWGRRAVLRGLSFMLLPGEVLVVTGPNGAGKTTLLDLIAALAPPDEGSLEVCGADAAAEPEDAKERVGYLPDSFPLYDELTPIENLQFVARMRGRSAGLKAIVDALGRAGIASRAEDPCKDLSAGMRRRLALVAATMHEPRLLLLDEPLATMDTSGRDLVLGTLALRREKRKASVVATHDASALLPVMTHKLELGGGTGEVRSVEVDPAVRTVEAVER